MIKIYMYYETDDDSGYYAIQLFQTKELAIRYKKLRESPYGKITSYIIHESFDDFLDLEADKESRNRELPDYMKLK